jgi:sulfopyruvate decarboxylase subunit beta
VIERSEATSIVVELAGNRPIVRSIGNPNSDLATFERPQNYYVCSMGMASSVGLGVALARPKQRVIILDGDGAILMNLSSLPTAAMAGAPNLVHVIWDNRRWEITGGQPTATALGTDLAGIAHASGFRNAVGVQTLEAFRTAFTRAMNDTEPWVIVAAVEPGNSKGPSRLSFVQNRDRFMAAVAANDE